MTSFYKYCKEFYGAGGIYDLGVSNEDIMQAIEIRKKEKSIPFDGDSIDREMVRDILQQSFGGCEKKNHYAQQDSYEDQLIQAIWNEAKTVSDQALLTALESEQGSMQWMEYSTLLSIYKEILTGTGLFEHA